MAIERLSIKDFLQRRQNALVLDVRSPAEYDHAHMPGAVNLPLFSNEERKAVGTAYKQQSREDAIKIGLDFFAPNMRRMVETVEEQVKTRSGGEGGKNTVLVYCWRGGMRSAAVAWLLDLYGFKISTLAGGYKAFRNHVLQCFHRPFPFKMLGGYTGSGKTEVLQELATLGESIIDLEQLACHKGSAFGALKMPPQPTQEMFENRLALELELAMNRESEKQGLSTIWLEDESQRIGNLNIPTPLWHTMREAPVLFLDIPFEERLDHIMGEYGDCDKDKLVDAVRRISQRLGGFEAKNAIQFLEEGHTREAFSILLQYYDKRYIKALNNRESIHTLLTRMPCEKPGRGNAPALTKHQTV